MNVKYEKSFAKDLKNVKEKNLLKRVKEVIDKVKKADNHKELNNLKKLKGYDNFYQVKFGDYRIGVEIVKDEIIFTRLLHRKDIYRYFPQ